MDSGKVEMIDARQVPLFLKQALLHQGAGLRIFTKNVGDLCKRPVVSCGMSHHVARDRANAAESMVHVWVAKKLSDSDVTF